MRKYLKLLIIVLVLLLSAYLLGYHFPWLHFLLQEADTSLLIVDTPSDVENSINDPSVKTPENSIDVLPLDNLKTSPSTDPLVDDPESSTSTNDTEKEKKESSFKTIFIIITSNSFIALFFYFCGSIILHELMELDPGIINAVLDLRRNNPPREAA